MNKTSGGDGIPAELFPILKDDAVKEFIIECYQYSFPIAFAKEI